MALLRPLPILLLVVVLSSCGQSSVPLLLQCEGSPAGTIYVNTAVDESGDGASFETAFKTVTEALAAAPGGGHLCIAPGTYREGEPIELDKTITLEGAVHASDKDARATLHGGDLHRVINVAPATEVLINNLTITHGSETIFNAGGIHNEGFLTLLDTIVIANSSNFGGAIVNSGNLVLDTGTRITENKSSGSAGGIANRAGTITLLSGAVISGNEAADLGGGLFNNELESTAMIFIRSGAEIRGNSAQRGGGGIMNDGILVLEPGSVVAGNTTSGFGGGIYNDNEIVIAAATVVTGNAAGISGGGGIYNTGNGAVMGETSGVAGNSPGEIVSTP